MRSGSASAMALAVAGTRASQGGDTRCRPPTTACTAGHSRTSQRPAGALRAVSTCHVCKQLCRLLLMGQHAARLGRRHETSREPPQRSTRYLC